MANTKSVTDSSTYVLDEAPLEGSEQFIAFSFDAPVLMERLECRFILQNTQYSVPVDVAFSLDGLDYSDVATVELNTVDSVVVRQLLGESLGSQETVYLRLSCNHDPEVSTQGTVSITDMVITARSEITGLVTKSYQLNAGIGSAVSSQLVASFSKGDSIDLVSDTPNNRSENQITNVVDITSKPLEIVDILTTVAYDGLYETDCTIDTKLPGVHAVEQDFLSSFPNDFRKLDRSVSALFYNVLPYVDIGSKGRYRKVDLYFDKPKKPDDYRYLPTADFVISDELIGFTGDFFEPIDFDKLKTVMSPVGMPTTMSWKRPTPVNANKRINWGYGVNAFIVAGGTVNVYIVDPDELEPSDPEPKPQVKVITIVNDVTVVALPSRQPILFSELQLKRDHESFAWACDITISDPVSFALIKPTSASYTDIEIDINGNKWVCFVGSSSKRTAFGKQEYRIKGYSRTALLQEKYSGTANYANNTQMLASQLVTDVLGTINFSSTWNTTDWLVPALTLTYQGKSPIQGIAQIANAVGGIIVPSLTSDEFSIEPWCKTSPWNWQDLNDLPVLDSANSYSVDEDYMPAQQADSVFVSGATNGLIARCSLNNTLGNNLLPTIQDPLITDQVSARERGRIALAKSGHKENVPINTFVESGVPLNLPGNMVNVQIDGDNWNGMISSISITVRNQGSVVTQQLSVLRHLG